MLIPGLMENQFACTSRSDKQTNKNGYFKSIMVYQDHFTMFIALRIFYLFSKCIVMIIFMFYHCNTSINVFVNYYFRNIKMYPITVQFFPYYVSHIHRLARVPRPLVIFPDFAYNP